MGWLKDMMKNWLEIYPAGGGHVTVMSDMSFETEVFRNRIWYRGKAAELGQFYMQCDDLVGNTSFWASGGKNMNIRKLHSGLPALIADTISDIAVNDYLGAKVTGGFGGEVWEKTAKANGFMRLLKRAVREALVLGDGAFKISIDKEVSDYPIIEFFGADRVRFVYERGRVAAVVFMNEYQHGNKRFVLEERYDRKGISYTLLDGKGNEAPLETLEETAGLLDITHNGNFCMAAPLIFDENSRFAGRGKSIFDNKTGAFDGLDEILSQWIDSLRDGRVVKYIPVNLLPRNPLTGEVLHGSGFESRFVQTEADMAEGADNGIRVVQPNICTDALYASYVNFLDMCLQGIIAPSTLGIDMKKLDNAEAQREKEKATLYTRNKIVGVLQEVLPELIVAAVKAYDCFYGIRGVEYIATVEFGEYANPSFEAQIETIGRGRQLGVMSIENAMEQLYGTTWTQEQKRAEAERLREEMI